MLGYAYFLNGGFQNAIQTLQETIDTGKKSGAINTTIGAYCVLARLYAIHRITSYNVCYTKLLRIEQVDVLYFFNSKIYNPK